MGQNLPALPCTDKKRHHWRKREKRKHPLRRSNEPTERSCLPSTPKLRTAKWVRQKQGKHCVTTRTCERRSVRSLSPCRCCQQLLTLFRTVCLRIDLAFHWTLHDNVSRRMRFSAQGQAVSHFTCAAFANDWRKRLSNSFCELVVSKPPSTLRHRPAWSAAGLLRTNMRNLLLAYSGFAILRGGTTLPES